MRRLLLFALCAASACGRDPAPVTPPVAGQPAAFQVGIDHRIELFSILFRLAEAEEYRMAQATAYLAAVDRHFAPHRDHPAVAATRRVRKEVGIGFDAPMSLAVFLDHQLRPIRALRPWPPGLDPRWQKVAVDDYLAEVRDFARDSGAEAFFAGHRAYFAAVEERFGALIAREDPVSWFDAFFGARAGASYRLVPGLLTGGANYGPSAEHGDGRVKLYSIVSLEDIDGGGLPRPSRFTAELVVHELAHSYVNPLVDRHAAELAPAMKRIYPLVAAEMRKQAYGDWRIVARESLVRAVTQLYVRRRHGDQAADRLAREDERIAFYWTAELATELAGRRSRGDLEAEMPRVVDFFERLAVRYAGGIPIPPFRGPINEVLRREPALVEPSRSASPELAVYIAAVRKEIYPSAAALPGDAGEMAVQAQVLYGSPASSPLIAGLLRDSGWTVDESGIALAGQRFDGAGLVLIACRPHPRDPQLPVLVYTAARDSDIVNSNAVYHGPTDWVVARRDAGGRFTIVASGDFPRSKDGAWRLGGPNAR